MFVQHETLAELLFKPTQNYVFPRQRPNHLSLALIIWLYLCLPHLLLLLFLLFRSSQSSLFPSLISPYAYVFFLVTVVRPISVPGSAHTFEQVWLHRFLTLNPLCWQTTICSHSGCCSIVHFFYSVLQHLSSIGTKYHSLQVHESISN